MTISDQLREAIERYGTLYAVARDSGMSYAVLRRFMAGERDVYLGTADKLCEFFGMHLTKPKVRKPKPNGRRTKK